MFEGWAAATAVIGGAATLGGAIISSNASGNAANAQAGAAANSNAEQQREFNTVQQEYAPQRNIGYGADSLLAQLYGMPDPNAASTNSLYPANSAIGVQTTPSPAPNSGAFGSFNGIPGLGNLGQAIGNSKMYPNSVQGQSSAQQPRTSTAGGAPDYSKFYNSPGYQFNLQQGQQAIQRGATARGDVYTPNTLNSLGNYAQGVASNQYNNYVQQLMGLAGLGGQATAGTANAAISTGNNISTNMLAAGNANASGILGSGNAWSKAINSNGFQNLFSGFGGNGSSYTPDNNYGDEG